MKELRLPQGFYAGGIRGGLKEKNLDIGFVFSHVVCQAAGVFTQNQLAAAPVQLSRQVLQDGRLQGIIVNSGNANAVTGQQGIEDAQKMQLLFAKIAGVSPELIAVSSTGIIGRQLPMEKIEKAIIKLDVREKNLADFQQAIMTTDTQKKAASATLQIENKQIQITGIVKGSGMIHPNMGTMLAFILTDAEIPADRLSFLLKQAADNSFNQVTVDGEASTNDSCYLMANGASGVVLEPDSVEEHQFYTALEQIMIQMAKQVAQDGEGATKLLEVQILGAPSLQMARVIAKEIAGSMLVKTAMFGADPNWGRIMSAAGNGGFPLEPEKINLKIGSHTVLKEGTLSVYDEKKLRQYLQGSTIVITVDLQDGHEQATAWGCDLSYEYIKINGLYHA